MHQGPPKEGQDHGRNNDYRAALHAGLRNTTPYYWWGGEANVRVQSSRLHQQTR